MIAMGSICKVTLSCVDMVCGSLDIAYCYADVCLGHVDRLYQCAVVIP